MINFGDVMGGVMLACCPELRFVSFEFEVVLQFYRAGSAGSSQAPAVASLR